MGKHTETPPPPRECQHTSTRLVVSDQDGKPAWITETCTEPSCGMPVRTYKP